MKFWDNPAAKAMTLWIAAFAAVLLFALLTSRCSGSGGPAQQATRTAVYVIEALCQPSMTVEECGKVIEERAGLLDQMLDAGGN